MAGLQARHRPPEGGDEKWSSLPDWSLVNRARPWHKTLDSISAITVFSTAAPLTLNRVITWPMPADQVAH